MTDEIKPALTPKEWTEIAAAERGDFNCAPMIYLRAIEHRGTGPHQLDRPHALAALALHNQPFGFTWEDVDALERSAREVFTQARDTDEDFVVLRKRMMDDQRQLRSLADRIAALLPPRG